MNARQKNTAILSVVVFSVISGAYFAFGSAIFLHAAQAWFAISFIGLLCAYVASGHLGVFLAMTITFCAAAVSFKFHVWWPLGAGFVLNWVLRLSGLDPGWQGFGAPRGR